MGKIDLIETDILYALMDVHDAHHKTAIKVFDRVKKKKFFDSHYAAYAKRTKSGILSMDKVYDRISEVERIDPRSLVGDK